MKITLYSILVLLIFVPLTFLPDSFARDAPHRVRMVYFLPRDRKPQPDMDVTMDDTIKTVQKFYANQMEQHGFGRKTFPIETDADGNAVVHRVNGKFNEAYYVDFDFLYQEAWNEVKEHFNTSQDIYLVVMETNSLFLQHGTKINPIHGERSVAGVANKEGNLGGLVAITQKFFIDNFVLVAHELGHIFGLDHDFRELGHSSISILGDDESYLLSNIMSYGPWYTKTVRLSECAAESLDVHRYFNAGWQYQDFSMNTTVRMLSPTLMSQSNTVAVRFHFELTDPDGLYQAQLLGILGGNQELSLIDCKLLDGSRNRSVEFVTSSLIPERNDHIVLKVIDIHGNISTVSYPIDIISLLPPAKVVRIPDPNLAKTVRETLGLAPGDKLTSHKMLELTHLYAKNRRITDLTGLEHAGSLIGLWLGYQFVSGKGQVNSNAITDLLPLAGLTQLTSLDLSGLSISDVSPLAGLTNLTTLKLSRNSIMDISPLVRLTQLRELHLFYNTISDVSPLAGLENLEKLQLGNNSITDISPLAGLKNLISLTLWSNPITDISPLAGLTKLIELHLTTTSVSDISPLAGLKNLNQLHLSNNLISDISPLSGLTQLWWLELNNYSISDVSPLSSLAQEPWLLSNTNSISDISPLVKLPNLEKLNLRRNPLSYISIHTHIPTIQKRGTEVQFNKRPQAALVKISGDSQAAEVGTLLANPFVVQAMDEYSKPMAGVVVTFTVTSGGGTVSATTATTSTKGRVRTILRLGSSPGLNTVTVTAKGIQSSAIFAANATGPPIYWIESENGALYRSTGATVENFMPSVQKATDLVVDIASGKLYWTEQISNRTGKIQRASLDGSNIKLVKDLTSVPHDLAVDTFNDKLYLVNSWGKIQRLNVDGSNFEPNLITDLDSPKGIAVDMIEGKVYWTEQMGEASGKIRRANLDGSNIELVKSLTSAPRDLAIDTAAGKLYLTNSWGKVQRLNFDGSNFQPNLITDLDSPKGIVVDMIEGKLYWTETDSISCSNLSGEDIQKVVTGLAMPTDIVLARMLVNAAVASAPAVPMTPPEETTLLPNYPNPFNPETWIPYQLSKPADVTLTIYAVNGKVVRRLSLGHQDSGMYQNRSRAAYWDGRNQIGEPVASGIYFYHIQAGAFSATRRMLILK